MKQEIFIDTGAWLALADQNDFWHSTAKQTYALLLKTGQRLVTSNMIVAESYTLIQRRLGHRAAITYLDMFHQLVNVTTSQPPNLVKVYADGDIDNQAEAILRQYADQDFSFIDAVSFAVMRQRGIKTAFGL